MRQIGQVLREPVPMQRGPYKKRVNAVGTRLLVATWRPPKIDHESEKRWAGGLLANCWSIGAEGEGPPDALGFQH